MKCQSIHTTTVAGHLEDYLMKHMIIETRRFFKKQKIEILPNQLTVYKKTLFKYLEYEISFDNIETRKTVKAEINRDIFAVGVLGVITGTVVGAVGEPDTLAIWWGISLILILVGLLTRKRTIVIQNYSNDPLVLDFNKHSEKKVREFADQIINNTKTYLINKYSRVDKDLPIDNQLNSLEFLRDKDLITEIKFEELKNKLLGRKSDNNAIGFEK